MSKYFKHINYIFHNIIKVSELFFLMSNLPEQLTNLQWPDPIFSPQWFPCPLFISPIWGTFYSLLEREKESMCKWGEGEREGENPK